MSGTVPPAQADQLGGYEGSIQGTTVERALDEQREALWLAQSIVDSIAGSLNNMFGKDWPAKFPDWPRALRGVSRMVDTATGAMEAGVLEDRAVELAGANLAAERPQDAEQRDGGRNNPNAGKDEGSDAAARDISIRTDGGIYDRLMSEIAALDCVWATLSAWDLAGRPTDDKCRIGSAELALCESLDRLQKLAAAVDDLTSKEVQS